MSDNRMRFPRRLRLLAMTGVGCMLGLMSCSSDYLSWHETEGSGDEAVTLEITATMQEMNPMVNGAPSATTRGSTQPAYAQYVTSEKTSSAFMGGTRSGGDPVTPPVEQPSAEEYASRVAKVNNQTIDCFALFVIKHEEVTTNSRIVGYRIFIKPTDDGGTDKRFLFRNLYGLKDSDDNTIADILLSETGGQHNGSVVGTDDSQSSSSVYGLNGWKNDSDEKVYVYCDPKNPLHGPVESFTCDANYTICCISNFNESASMIADEPVGKYVYQLIKYWQDHKADANFDGIPYSGDGAGFFGAEPLITGRVLLADATINNWALGEGNPSINDHITSPTYLHHYGYNLISSYRRKGQLRPGHNAYNFKLTRNVSRVTFKVANYSESPMRITDFSLNNRFAQAAYALFVEKELIYGHSSTLSGSPNVSSDKAIYPFVADQVYLSAEQNAALAAGDGETPGIVLPAGSYVLSEYGDNHVMFDALMAGGYDAGAPLSFNMGVQIPEDLAPRTPIGYDEYFETNYAITNIPTTYEQINTLVNDNIAWPIGEERYFLMQSIVKENSGSLKNKVIHPFIYMNGGVMKGTTEDGLADRETKLATIYSHLANNTDLTYLWVFKKVEAGKIIIQNYGTEDYCKVNSNAEANVSFTSNENEATYFTIGRYSGTNGATGGTYYDDVSKNVTYEGYTYNYALPYANGAAVGFETTIDGKQVYMNMYSWDKNLRVASMQQWSDGGAHFWLVPVEVLINTIQTPIYPPEPEGVLTKSLTNQPIKVFTNEQGSTQELHELRRGDHLTVQVNVRYNNFTQDIEFEVKGEVDGSTIVGGWVESDNVIEFE